MKLTAKAGILWHIAKWRATWSRRDLDYCPADLKNPKFMSARKAVELIHDNAVVFSNGMAANARCQIYFWAVRDRFDKTGHPRDLTWITVGAQGSRGRTPGSLEELGVPGIVKLWIGGHLETVKTFLKLGQESKMEIHRMAQGIMTFLLEAQARGEDSLLTKTGVGTLLDPRIDNGTPVVKGIGKSFTTAEGEYLRYRLPKIEFAIFNAPYADEEGNIYIRNAACVTENRESSLAAKKNGGKVLACVADVIPKSEKEIFLPADKVDAIVVNPYNEQTGSIPQRKYWKMFTEGANEDVIDAVDRLKFANNMLKITPVRGSVENAMARMAANLFTKIAKPGSYVNVGVGLPEEVSRLIYEGGLAKDVKYVVETGILGGLPSMGVFFGSSINPEKIMTSAEIFRLCYEKLDVTILGLLQADCQGNINVSKRGEGPINYVGPGGLPDLAASAKTLIFIGTWMAHAKMTIADGKLKIIQPGTSKFVPKVDEITFNGQEALKAGKKVYYCTNLGIFRLTDRGMELIEVMPGVDIDKDITKSCPMSFVLPESGKVDTVPQNIVTGIGFKLSWQNK
jgi:propionate CoA-transferase